MNPATRPPPNEIPPTSPQPKRPMDAPEEEPSPKRPRQDEPGPRLTPFPTPTPAPYPNAVPPTYPNGPPMTGWGPYPGSMMNPPLWHQYPPPNVVMNPHWHPKPPHMDQLRPGLPIPSGLLPTHANAHLPTPDSNGQPTQNAISTPAPTSKETEPTTPKTKTPKSPRARKVVDQDANFEQALPKRKRKPTPKAKQNQEESDETKTEEVAVPQEDQNWEVEVAWPEGAFVKKGKTKTYYNAVTVNGATYAIGDTVAMWPSPGSTFGPIGKIVKMFDDGEANIVECVWYYRPEETVFFTKRMKVGPREVYESDHRDDNPVEAIAKKVIVNRINDIEDLETFISAEDCFYFQKKYDHINKRFEDLK